jgi:hypothetical protein
MKEDGVSFRQYIFYMEHMGFPLNVATLKRFGENGQKMWRLVSVRQAIL